MAVSLLVVASLVVCTVAAYSGDCPCQCSAPKERSDSCSASYDFFAASDRLFEDYKETVAQLRTPVSSAVAWGDPFDQEAKREADRLFVYMSECKDIECLEKYRCRWRKLLQKIGQEPTLSRRFSDMLTYVRGYTILAAQAALVIAVPFIVMKMAFVYLMVSLRR